MIHATPPIDPALESKLAELDAVRSELRDEVGMGTPWNAPIRRQALIDSVTSSAAIEGYTVDAATATALVRGGRPPADEDNQRAIAAYARAMHHVAVMADDPSFDWSDRILLDLHFDACDFQRDSTPGRWRTGPVFVTRADDTIEYTAPPAGQVAPLMSEVSNWLRSGDLDTHVAVRAAMAHLHVVSVHPFRDGNGRVSRLAQSLVLARSGVLSPAFGSIEPFLYRHTTEYYAQLQEAHGPAYEPHRDARRWVEFCIDAHIEQARERIDLIELASRRWRTLDAFIQSRGWPERLVIALDQALTGRTDRAAYVLEADISAPAASLDFRRLVDAGLLDVTSSGRTTSYVPSETLRTLVDGR